MGELIKVYLMESMRSCLFLVYTEEDVQKLHDLQFFPKLATRKGSTYLDKFEALYLLRDKKIQIVYKDNSLVEKFLGAEELVQKLRFYEEAGAICFDSHFAVYSHFRRLGFVVKANNSYGGHFLLYDRDPDECHARFVVYVKGSIGDSEENLAWLNAITSIRVAKSTLKRFVIAEANIQGDGSVHVESISLTHITV